MLVTLSLLLSANLHAQRDTQVLKSQPTGDIDAELVRLSPFTVSTSRDSGYFSANTLAGSRMDTNLADFGAFISGINAQ